MSKVSELIERLEKETGQRIDDNGGDNFAKAGLLGAMASALGKSNHNPHDDVIAGIVVKHRMSPEYKQEQRPMVAFANMLSGGVSPDDIKALGDELKGKS